MEESFLAEIQPTDLGDVVELKRSHACGANEWEVTRLGMDIGLRCRKCGRQVRMSRSRFDGRLLRQVSRSSDAGASGGDAARPPEGSDLGSLA